MHIVVHNLHHLMSIFPIPIRIFVSIIGLQQNVQRTWQLPQGLLDGKMSRKKEEG